VARRRTIDIQDGDDAWVEKFTKDIDDVCGMIEEAFERNPAMLLSPVIRGMLREKAKELEKKLEVVRGRVCVDNPSIPLNNKGG
jgi:ribosomal protein L13